MPWREQSTMSRKQEFVVLAQQEGVNFAELCRRYGISRPTGYALVRRYREQGAAGLAERSRRPHTMPTRTAPAMEAAVLAVRDAHPSWGGRKLKRRLEDLAEVAAPAASTCTAILRRHDRLDPAAAAQHTAWQRFEHPAPNDLWQLDFKGHRPLTQGRCHPLSAFDDHSRFALGLVACADEQDATVRTALTALFRRYGLPARILTDNGPPWGNPHPTQRLTAFSFWLIRLGIDVLHGRPFHPQTQGKVERFHRTLMAELLRTTPLVDLGQAQRCFDRWRDSYNLERPHHALDLATPAARYAPSPRPFPDPLPPLEYGPDDAVRTVHGGGQIAFRGRDWFVTQALRGEPVAVRPTATDGVFAVVYCHYHLATLDLHAHTIRPTHRPDGAEEERAQV